jgi:hypothetical protein
LKGRNNNIMPSRPSRQSLVPVRHNVKPMALETAMLEPQVQHRWLLTTCIVGVAATLLVGGLTLGMFGQNAVPSDANAAVATGNIDPVTQSASGVS